MKNQWELANVLDHKEGLGPVIWAGNVWSTKQGIRQGSPDKIRKSREKKGGVYTGNSRSLVENRRGVKGRVKRLHAFTLKKSPEDLRCFSKEDLKFGTPAHRTKLICEKREVS